MYSCVTASNQQNMYFRTDEKGRKVRISQKKLEQLAARFHKEIPTCEPSKTLQLSNSLASIASLQREKQELLQTLETRMSALTTSQSELQEKRKFLQEAQAEIENAKELMLGLQGKVKLNETDIENLKQSLSDLSFDLNKTLKEKEEVEKEFALVKANLLNELSEVKKDYSNFQTNANDLLDKSEATIVALKQKIEDLTVAKDAAIATLNQQILDIRAQATKDVEALTIVMNDKTSALYIEIETLKSQYAILKSQADTAAAQNEKDKDTISTLQSNLAEAEKNVEKCTNELSVTQTKLNSTSTELSTILGEKQQALVNSAKISADKQRQITALANLKKQLTSQVTEIKADLSASQTLVSELKAQIQSITLEAEKNSNSLQHKILALTKEIDQTKNVLAEVMKQNSDLMDDKKELQSLLSSTRESHELAQRQDLIKINSINETVTQLKDENAKLIDDIRREVETCATTATTTNSDYELRIINLRETVKMLENNVSDNNKQIMDLIDEKAQLLSSNQALQTSIGTIQSDVENESQAVAKYKAEIEQLHNTQKDLLHSLDKAIKVEKQLERVEQDLLEAKREEQTLQYKLNQKSDEVLSEKQKYEVAMFDHSSALSRLEKTISDLTNRKDELEGQLGTLNETFSKKMAELDEKTIRIGELGDELEKSKIDLSKCNVDKGVLSDKLIDSKRELEVANFDLTTAKSSKLAVVNQLTAKIEQCTQELDSLKQTQLAQTVVTTPLLEPEISVKFISSLDKIFDKLVESSNQYKTELIELKKQTNSESKIKYLQNKLQKTNTLSHLVEMLKKAEAAYATVEKEHQEFAKEIDRLKQEVLTCQVEKSSVQTQLDSALNRCSETFESICMKDELGAQKCMADITNNFPNANSCFANAESGGKCIEKILSKYPDVLGLKIEEGKVTTLLIGAGEDIVEGTLPTPIPVQTQVSATILPLVQTNPGLKQVVDSIELGQKEVRVLQNALEGVKLEVEQSTSKALAAQSELTSAKEEIARLTKLMATHELEKATINKQVNELRGEFANYTKEVEKVLGEANAMAENAAKNCESRINNIRTFSTCTESEQSAKQCIEELNLLFSSQSLDSIGDEMEQRYEQTFPRSEPRPKKPKAKPICPSGLVWDKLKQKCIVKQDWK